MQKIISYIKNGKGIGALWLLIFGAFKAFYLAYNVNRFLPDLIPYVQNLADEFLPIKIENGKVIEPIETIKTHDYQVGKDHIVLKLDTTKDILDEEDLAQGIYLTRSYFYTINGQEIRRQTLKGDINLEKRDYVPFLQTLVKWIVWGVLIIGPFLYFTCFLIAVLFYAFCTGLSCVLNKTELDFKKKMRLNTVLFIGLYIVTFALESVGLNISTLAFFLAMIALELVTVKKIGN